MTQNSASSFIKIFRIAVIYPLIFLLILLYARTYGVQFLSGSKLPVLATVPNFTLTERSGKNFSLQDLKGKVWVGDFIFTRCGGICPMMSTKMRELALKLPKTKFVSFSVDPTYDTPEVLAAYADGYEARKDQWFFLSGDAEKINQVITGIHLSRVDEPMMHSSRFILVDKEGRVRGYYDSEDVASMKKLMKDAKILL